MPLLHSLGQHGALQKLHLEELREEETLLAFLDDTHVVCPDRTITVHAALLKAMFSTTGIRINSKKTKVWNAVGVKSAGCGVLQRIAEAYDPTAVVWRGPELPTHRQGLNVLGFVRTSLEMKNIGHQCFLDRIPLLEDASFLVVVGPVCSCTTESPNVHILGSRPSKTPREFNEKTPRERETEKERNGGGRGKKKSEMLGCPAEGRSGGGGLAEGRSGGGWSAGVKDFADNCLCFYFVV